MTFADLVHEITQKPLASLTIVFNLVVIESLLSVDNAAVLATMVMNLDKDKRGKALRYGIVGAYIFRGVFLFFAAFLIHIWWLKAIAGAYLLYLCIKYFIKRDKNGQSEEEVLKEGNWIYRQVVKVTGPFWATVLMVEIMDMAFSLDNVFAAVAFTRNIILVWVGVFIGIFAMRFVAQGFVKLIARYPFLETSAHLVLGVLGIKLLASLLHHYDKGSAIGDLLCNPHMDMYTSGITVAIFLLPLLSSLLFNYPKKK